MSEVSIRELRNHGGDVVDRLRFEASQLEERGDLEARNPDRRPTSGTLFAPGTGRWPHEQQDRQPECDRITSEDREHDWSPSVRPRSVRAAG